MNGCSNPYAEGIVLCRNFLYTIERGHKCIPEWVIGMIICSKRVEESSIK
jgi:hypothetical protein